MVEKRLNGGQIVCEALLNEGVDVLFGLPGGAILPFYGELSKYPGLRHVLVRHEQARIFGYILLLVCGELWLSLFVAHRKTR